MNNIELILSRLDKVQSSGKGKWLACCPSHSDRSPSLRITEAPDKILMHCFAGCHNSEVLAAIGLNESALFYESLDTDFYTVKQKDELDTQIWFIAIAASDKKKGIKFNKIQMDRVAKCLKSIYSELNKLKRLEPELYEKATYVFRLWKESKLGSI